LCGGPCKLEDAFPDVSKLDPKPTCRLRRAFFLRSPVFGEINWGLIHICGNTVASLLPHRRCWLFLHPHPIPQGHDRNFSVTLLDWNVTLDMITNIFDLSPCSFLPRGSSFYPGLHTNVVPPHLPLRTTPPRPRPLLIGAPILFCFGRDSFCSPPQPRFLGHLPMLGVRAEFPSCSIFKSFFPAVVQADLPFSHPSLFPTPFFFFV